MKKKENFIERKEKLFSSINFNLNNLQDMVWEAKQIPDEYWDKFATDIIEEWDNELEKLTTSIDTDIRILINNKY